MILNLSDNNNLPELDFLPDNVVILQLIKTNTMKLVNTIHHLKKLKKLKYLNIQASKKEIELLKIALPNCIIN
jgi:hypothetical protein